MGDEVAGAVVVHNPHENASDRGILISTEEHARALLGYAAAFDSRKRGPYEISAFLDIFAGYPLAQVRAAIREHYKRSRWDMRPADLITLIEDGEV